MQRAKTWARRKFHPTSAIKTPDEVALFPTRVGSSPYPSPKPNPLHREKGYVGDAVDLKPKPAAKETALAGSVLKDGVNPDVEIKESDAVESADSPDITAAVEAPSSITPSPAEESVRPTPPSPEEGQNVEVTPSSATNSANRSVETTPLSRDPAPYAASPPSSDLKAVAESVEHGANIEKTIAADAPMQRAKAWMSRKFHGVPKPLASSTPSEESTAEDVFLKRPAHPLGLYSQGLKDESLVDHTLYINDVHLEHLGNRLFYVHLCQRCDQPALLFTYKAPDELPLSEDEPSSQHFPSKTDVSIRTQRVYCKMCRTYYVLRYERLGKEAIEKVLGQRDRKKQIAARGDPHSTEPQPHTTIYLNDWARYRHRISPEIMKWGEDHAWWPKSLTTDALSNSTLAGPQAKNSTPPNDNATTLQRQSTSNELLASPAAVETTTSSPLNPPTTSPHPPATQIATKTIPLSPSPPKSVPPALSSSFTLYLNDVQSYLHASLGDPFLILGLKYYSYQCVRCSKTSINAIYFPYQSKRVCPVRSDEMPHPIAAKTRYAKCRACASSYVLHYEVLDEGMEKKRAEERERKGKEVAMDGTGYAGWGGSEPPVRGTWEYRGGGMWAPT